MSNKRLSWMSPIRRSGESRPDRSEELAWESKQRLRLGVPAAAGGVLYLLSGIIIQSALSSAPTVGLLQALKAPIAQGIAEPAVSPRAAEVKFVGEQTFALIAGSVLSAISLVILTFTLLLLVRATRFRRPESWAPTAMLVLLGGIGFAAVGLGHQIAEAILTHQFATSSDHSNKAVQNALTRGPANIISDYISLITGLFLAAGMIVTALGAMRVGLIARWMGIVGALAGLLIFLPIGGAELEIIPAFWLVAMGILYMGRWPNGDPPAWEAGEAIPWPSQAERVKQGGAQAERRNGKEARRPAKVDAATSAALSKKTDESGTRAAPGSRRRRKHGSHR